MSDNPLSPNGLTGTITGTNPNFSTGMLAFNGGPTQTIALSSASTAALGQATTTTGIMVDQRGVHRNAATPDVGAFEFTPPPATTYTVTVATDNSGSMPGTGSGTRGDLRYCIDQATLDEAPPTPSIRQWFGRLDHYARLRPDHQPTIDEPLRCDRVRGQRSREHHDQRGPAPGLSISGDNAERLFAVAGGAP